MTLQTIKNILQLYFNRYGDVRGNYTDYMILDMSMDGFYEVIMEASMVNCTVTIKGIEYQLSTDCTKEACLFDVYSDNTDKYFDKYDVYIDIDNLRSKASIKKGLMEYLKESAA